MKILEIIIYFMYKNNRYMIHQVGKRIIIIETRTKTYIGDIIGNLRGHWENNAKKLINEHIKKQE